MALRTRRAQLGDAESICAVAHSCSKSVRLESGDSDEDLSRYGFLLYPLEAESEQHPNYRERTASEHFWVVTENDVVIAFLMAYTFERMKAFAHLTLNDEAVLDYFLNRCGFEENCLYLAQAAVAHGRRGDQAMARIAPESYSAAVAAGVPAMITEIAQSPEKNIISTQSALRQGFRMVSTRTKHDPVKNRERTSGTFMLTLPHPSARSFT